MAITLTPASQLPYQAGAHFGEGNGTGLTVTAAADSEIAVIQIIAGARHLLVEVKNSHGSVAFDAFTIQRRPNDSAAWEMLANTAGNYSTPDEPILEVSGAPVTLAAGSSTFIRMELQATQAIRIAASGNGAESTADIHWRVQ